MKIPNIFYLYLGIILLLPGISVVFYNVGVAIFVNPLAALGILLILSAALGVLCIVGWMESWGQL